MLLKTVWQVVLYKPYFVEFSVGSNDTDTYRKIDWYFGFKIFGYLGNVLIKLQKRKFGTRTTVSDKCYLDISNLEYVIRE